MTALLAAIGHLSVVRTGVRPVPGAVAWFAVVGAAIGAAVGLSYELVEQWWSEPVAAGAAVAVDLWLTAGRHVDGVADYADGLLGRLDPRRRLAILVAPDVGARGVAAVVVVLLARWLLVAEAGLRAEMVPVLAGIGALTRAQAAVVVGSLPTVRPGLPDAGFRGSAWPLAALGGPLLGVVLLATELTVPRAISVAAFAALVSWPVVARSLRTVGGISADTVGAVILAGEVAALAAVVGRLPWL